MEERREQLTVRVTYFPYLANRFQSFYHVTCTKVMHISKAKPNNVMSHLFIALFKDINCICCSWMEKILQEIGYNRQVSLYVFNMFEVLKIRFWCNHAHAMPIHLCDKVLWTNLFGIIIMAKHSETPPILGNVESHFIYLFYVNDKSISFMHYTTYSGIHYY
jgi:hypothetical protein